MQERADCYRSALFFLEWVGEETVVTADRFVETIYSVVAGSFCFPVATDVTPRFPDNILKVKDNGPSDIAASCAGSLFRY